MRLRFRLAFLFALGPALVFACGDDDTSSMLGIDGGGADASASDTGSNLADAGTDSATGIDSGKVIDAGTPAAKLQLVNAATDLGPSDPIGALRICFKIGRDADHMVWATLPPLPNRAAPGQPFPGLFMGTGGPVASTGVRLESLLIAPYLLSARSLQDRKLGSDIEAGADKDCQSLFEGDAGGAMAANEDFWVLPTLPAGTLKDGASYFLVLTGCAGDSTMTAEKCGAAPSGAPGLGNLTLSIFEVDTKTRVSSDRLGLQFVSVSPNLERELEKAGAALNLHIRPAIEKTPSSGSEEKLFGSVDGGPPGDVPPSTLTTLVEMSDVTPATDYLLIHPILAPSAMRMVDVAALSFGVADASAYANGRAYTVLAVGDPTRSDAGPNGSFDTKAGHFLALPNDPPVILFDPAK